MRVRILAILAALVLTVLVPLSANAAPLDQWQGHNWQGQHWNGQNWHRGAWGGHWRGAGFWGRGFGTIPVGFPVAVPTAVPVLGAPVVAGAWEPAAVATPFGPRVCWVYLPNGLVAC